MWLTAANVMLISVMPQSQTEPQSFSKQSKTVFYDDDDDDDQLTHGDREAAIVSSVGHLHILTKCSSYFSVIHHSSCCHLPIEGGS